MSQESAVALQELLRDDDIAEQMRTQFQGERDELLSIQTDIATSVRTFVATEAQAYQEAKAALLQKLQEARDDPTIKASIGCYETQAAKVQGLADKIVHGVQQIADRLEQDSDMDSAQRQEQLEQLHARLQQIMLTADEQDKLQTLTQMMGNVTTTATYLTQVPQCALRGLALTC